MWSSYECVIKLLSNSVLLPDLVLLENRGCILRTKYENLSKVVSFSEIVLEITDIDAIQKKKDVLKLDLTINSSILTST